MKIADSRVLEMADNILGRGDYPPKEVLAFAAAIRNEPCPTCATLESKLEGAHGSLREHMAMVKAAEAKCEELERKVQRYEFAGEEDEFDDKGINCIDLSPHYEEAVHQLTKRKAYSKSSCAQMIAEGWKAAEAAECDRDFYRERAKAMEAENEAVGIVLDECAKILGHPTCLAEPRDEIRCAELAGMDAAAKICHDLFLAQEVSCAWDEGQATGYEVAEEAIRAEIVRRKANQKEPQ